MDGITWRLGNEEQLSAIRAKKPFPAFAPETLAFLDAFSGRLRKNPLCRSFPDVLSYAFWIRRSNLESLKKEYLREDLRIGRRVALHFVPSNIPVLFAFSMTASLLAGNCVVVRMPQKTTSQESLILETLEMLLQEDAHPAFRGRILIGRWGHDSRINDELSAMADVRVIWGSDRSVAEIRRSPLPVGSIDIPFASRLSLAMLDARTVVDTEELDIFLHAFYNDTYRYDQNGCSSPRIICWKGSPEEIEEAQRRFWPALENFLDRNGYETSGNLAVSKLDAALITAARFPGSRMIRMDNRIVRVLAPAADPGLWDCVVPGGFFVEVSAESEEEFFPLLTQQCQTVSIYGIDRQQLSRKIAEECPAGADRIVPVGQTMDFSLTWDGMDLIAMMSRKIG